MDQIERMARALTEWEFGMTGSAEGDRTRYSHSLPERREAIDTAWHRNREQAAFLIGMLDGMNESVYPVIERLNRFAQTFNDEDEVDEESGLTGADLKEIVRHAQAGRNGE